MMNDSTTTDLALHWLIQQIVHESAENALWCSDENVVGLIPDSTSWNNKPRLISNRKDVAKYAEQQGLSSQFNDFDFSAFADNSLNQVFYRISKEKPVVHHIINEAFRILQPDGKLFICGQKKEGIKTYIEKASLAFGCGKSIQKNGTVYSAILEKKSATIEQLLDDSQYTELRPIETLDGITLYSKPGIFGWNKIDKGSELLIQHLPDLLAGLKHAPRTLLDLGCGYGYLGLMTAELALEKRVLTDNNAAALIAAAYNCEKNQLAAEIIAADCGDQITGSFDLILCNPPFHQGFNMEGDLTDKFISACKRLLTKNGIAFFVVNQFIPLERKASKHFSQVKVLADNSSFKLITLSH